MSETVDSLATTKLKHDFSTASKTSDHITADS